MMNFATRLQPSGRATVRRRRLRCFTTQRSESTALDTRDRCWGCNLHCFSTAFSTVFNFFSLFYDRFATVLRLTRVYSQVAGKL